MATPTDDTPPEDDDAPIITPTEPIPDPHAGDTGATGNPMPEPGDMPGPPPVTP